MDTNLQLAMQATNNQLHALRTLLNDDTADNAALQTTAKGNLVAAINETLQVAQSGAGIILDTSTAADKAWSAAKIAAYVAAETQASRDSLINGAPAEFDTMFELMNSIISNDGDISTAVSNIAANTALAQQGVDDAAAADAKAVTAQTTADQGVADAATASNAAATADSKAVTAQNDHNAFVAAVGPLDTDYAAIVNAGL